jgi:hypothetical protein
MMLSEIDAGNVANTELGRLFLRAVSGSTVRPGSTAAYKVQVAQSRDPSRKMKNEHGLEYLTEKTQTGRYFGAGSFPP